MSSSIFFFPALGVYGFDEMEPLILAALVSEDPILLIGKAGTGKTYLLNSISEAMAVEHRHYNASLISFDDLVGFPYPDAEGKSISFLPTPATIWQAESVLVDELSRCKPETQNKFFSIIHEKRVQGLPLEKLRYRWAAMNPVGFGSDDDGEEYTGSQPLDPALADRFAFIIEVPDWHQLSVDEQQAVIYPAGEAAISNDNGTIKQFVESLRPIFERLIKHPTPEVVLYARLIASLLAEGGLRISPRRARLLARNLTAVICVAQKLNLPLAATERKALYKRTLQGSLPHRAWKDLAEHHVVDSAHAEAVRLVFGGNSADVWVSEFLMKSELPEKMRHLFECATSQDTRSLGIIQLLARESCERAAIFALCLYPLAQHNLMLTEEALQALGEVAQAVMVIEAEISVSNNGNSFGWQQITLNRCQAFLNTLGDAKNRRRIRARQLFMYLITKGERVQMPEETEHQLQVCYEQVRKYVGAPVPCNPA